MKLWAIFSEILSGKQPCWREEIMRNLFGKFCVGLCEHQKSYGGGRKLWSFWSSEMLRVSVWVSRRPWWPQES